MRAWLENLPDDQIYGRDTLWEVFVGNFWATYPRPGNPWDLKNCW